MLGLAWVGIAHAVVGPQWTWDEGIEEPAGEKDMGGWMSRVYTEEQQKRLGVDEMGKKPEEPVLDYVDDETVGCCFDHGFGSRMVPCCFSNHRMIKKEECVAKNRMGGSTKFDTRECEVVMQEQGVDPVEQTLLQKLLPGVLPVNLDMLSAEHSP